MNFNEEHHEWSSLKGWIFIIGLMAGLMILMTIMMLIPQAKRHWDYGTVPFIPSETKFSTEVNKNMPKEKMIESLPEGVAMKDTKDTTKNH